jgi:catechol 2,3-dioxygenase-like lactoylglutathione lyase family enzyme
VLEVPALVPEIDVSDLAASLLVYRDVFGFKVLAERPEEAFAYLAIGSAHLMLQEANGPGRRFRTAPLERPYGRGVNLQVLVPDVTASFKRVQRADLEIVVPLEDRWYRQSDLERGNRQFVVADPDGYLIRFYQDLGSKPLSQNRVDVR